MKIIYLVGLSHSGSTLLDLMLHAHPDIYSLGEFRKLVPYSKSLKSKKSCTCGVHPLHECQFWQRLDAWVLQFTGESLFQFEKSDRPVNPALRSPFLIYRGIAEITGKNFIVDSSKRLGRLGQLLSTPGLEVLPVIITRDPFGHINSCVKSDLRKNRMSLSFPNLFFKTIKLIARFNKQSLELLFLKIKLRHRDFVDVKYHELVKNPEKSLNAILQPLGMNFVEEQLQWGGRERHHIGGNRMRKIRTSVLRIDESWQTELAWWQKVMIGLGTLHLSTLIKYFLVRPRSS